MPDRYQELREKYKLRIEKEFGRTANASASPKVSSREYTQFKQELYPARYSFYEKICNLSAKILNLKPDQKKAELMQKNLTINMQIYLEFRPWLTAKLFYQTIRFVTLCRI